MFRRTIAVTTTLGLLIALCASLAGAAADAVSSKGTARANVNRSRLVVHGKPFFPVMLIDQCSADAAQPRPYAGRQPDRERELPER